MIWEKNVSIVIFLDILNWEFLYSLEVEKVIITTQREQRET